MLLRIRGGRTRARGPGRTHRSIRIPSLATIRKRTGLRRCGSAYVDANYGCQIVPTLIKDYRLTLAAHPGGHGQTTMIVRFGLLRPFQMACTRGGSRIRCYTGYFLNLFVDFPRPAL
jgi:hypothetical protein